EGAIEDLQFVDGDLTSRALDPALSDPHEQPIGHGRRRGRRLGGKIEISVDVELHFGGPEAAAADRYRYVGPRSRRAERIGEWKRPGTCPTSTGLIQASMEKSPVPKSRSGWGWTATNRPA